MKKILILTAGFGEGHNAAARGLRDAFQQIAPDQAEVEMRDLFAETYGQFNEWTRRFYLELINRAPRAWSRFYRWLDARKSFGGDLRIFSALQKTLAQHLARFRPDVVVSVYPVYPHLLDAILGRESAPDGAKRIVVVTDSITVNSIWFRCSADMFLVPNEATEKVLRAAGVSAELIKVFGFPVNPKFAEGSYLSAPVSPARPRVLYMINAGKSTAPALVRRLVELDEIDLTVTVGRDKKLRTVVEGVQRDSGRSFEIVGWCNDLPGLLQSHHLLISKAGGATVQETIAAGVPMIINQVVPGQEEGNAQLIAETHSGAVVSSPESVMTEVRRAFANDAKVWREWATNIRSLSKPSASLDIARFLLGCGDDQRAGSVTSAPDINS